jgi:protein ImuB
LQGQPAGREADGFSRPLEQALDPLPLGSLSAAALHQPLLARMGCRCLSDLRRLPREGMARRFGADLLAAVDQAYGLRPAAFAWLAMPEVFASRLELPGRVESAAALMFAARRLLLQMCGWLAARQAGTRRFVLSWQHDFHRAESTGAGELEVRTAEITRDAGHLARLLDELLARVRLEAPVGEIALSCGEAEPLVLANRPLLPGADESGEGESLAQLLERLSARLGAGQVLRPMLRQDHRSQCKQAWYPATQEKPPEPRWPEPEASRWPEPSWLLSEPRPLAVRRERPCYRGPLELLSGPHRIESGWWDTSQPPEPARDYFVAFNQRAGLLWVYRQNRDEGSASGWFLQGIFG